MANLAATMKRLRGERKAIQIARSALGPDATPRQIKSFANYIGRIERGDVAVQNPSLEILGKVAKGLDVKLTDFFALLEGVPTLSDPHPKKGTPQPRITAVESDTPPERSDTDGSLRDNISLDAATIVSESVVQAAEHIASALDRLSTAIAAAASPGTTPARDRPAPAPPVRPTKRSGNGARRDRKSA